MGVDRRVALGPVDLKPDRVAVSCSCSTPQRCASAATIIGEPPSHPRVRCRASITLRVKADSSIGHLGAHGLWAGTHGHGTHAPAVDRAPDQRTGQRERQPVHGEHQPVLVGLSARSRRMSSKTGERIAPAITVSVEPSSRIASAPRPAAPERETGAGSPPSTRSLPAHGLQRPRPAENLVEHTAQLFVLVLPRRGDPVGEVGRQRERHGGADVSDAHLGPLRCPADSRLERC